MATTEQQRAPEEQVGRGGTYKTLDEQVVFDVIGAVLCVVGVVAMANVVGLV